MKPAAPPRRTASHHIVPMLAVFGIAFFLGPDNSTGQAQVTGGEPADRLVVVVVDSLRRATMEQPDVMPSLLAWSRSEGVRDLDVHTCSANFTLPCVQTLLEGRESPFAAGLHNFTGREGGAASLPAAALAAGLPYAVISDQTLTSLYGRGAVRSINVDDWDGTHLSRDLRAFDETMALLDDPSIRMVLLHVPGTDKASHLFKPGSPDYEHHFRVVDAKIGALIARLDPQHDALMITGDHGHNEDGHHTRESLAVLGGGPFRALFAGVEVPARVEQVDLLMELAWPNMLPIPADWEGALPAVAATPSERLARYLELQRLVLVAAGHDAPTLSQASTLARQSRESAHLNDVLAALPMLACLLVWVLLQARAGGPHPWASALGMAALGAGLAAITSPAAGPWLAAPVLGVGLWSAVRRVGARRVIWLLVLLAGTAALGRFALGWAETFHTRGGVIWQTPVFFVTLAVAGALLALVRDGTPRGMGTQALAFALLCLPSGVYYYQAGQNLLHPVAIGSVVWLLAAFARHPRAMWASLPPLRRLAAPLALVLGTLPLLFLHESGGWEYQFFPAGWLDRAGAVVQVGIWYGLGAALIWRASTRGERLLVVALIAMGHGYSAVLSGLPMSWLIVSQVPAVFAAGWLALPRLGGALPGPDRAEADGLVVLGAVLFAFWLLFRGFFFNNIDFTAGLRWFGALGRESDVFALAWLVTQIKYGVPVLLLVLTVRIARGAEATDALLERTLWLANLKVLALVVAVQAGGFDRTEKLWEVALSDLVFVANLMVMLMGSLAMIRLLDRARSVLPAPRPEPALTAP